MLPGELALRTATAAIFLVTGLVLLRDWRRTESGPFGGLLALSVAIVSVAGVDPVYRLWPLQMLAMGAPALFAGYSRLVIDVNRGLDHSTLIPEVSDGIVIPGNIGLSLEARQARIDALYHPWHRAVATELRRLDGADGRPATLIGIHSFTPQMDGCARPWQVGVLWDKPCALAWPLMAALAKQGLVVGDNEPYSARIPSGGTLEYHALDCGRPGLSLEIRQDLIAGERGQAEWAERLNSALAEALAAVPGAARCRI